MKLLDAVVSAMAVHRLTALVVEDEITRPIREGIERRFPDSQLSYLVTCPRCVSIWAGAAVAVATPEKVRLLLAYSAATIATKWAADLLEGALSG